MYQSQNPKNGDNQQSKTSVPAYKPLKELLSEIDLELPDKLSKHPLLASKEIYRILEKSVLKLKKAVLNFSRSLPIDQLQLTFDLYFSSSTAIFSIQEACNRMKEFLTFDSTRKMAELVKASSDYDFTTKNDKSDIEILIELFILAETYCLEKAKKQLDPIHNVDIPQTRIRYFDANTRSSAIEYKDDGKTFLKDATAFWELSHLLRLGLGLNSSREIADGLTVDTKFK